MRHAKGFTLIELIVAIAIIAILASTIAPTAFRAIEKSKISRAGSDAKTLRVATMQYYSDVGFWPPDVNRGVDPGFMQPDKSCAENPSQLASPPPYPDQGYSPNWNDTLHNNWDGPYLNKWPLVTPWAGKYDWNYWFNPHNIRHVDIDGNAVDVPAGCYIGVQGDYGDTRGFIPRSSEKLLVDNGFDFDGAVNGESQLLMTNLQ